MWSCEVHEYRKWGKWQEIQKLWWQKKEVSKAKKKVATIFDWYNKYVVGETSEGCKVSPAVWYTALSGYSFYSLSGACWGWICQDGLQQATSLGVGVCINHCGLGQICLVVRWEHMLRRCESPLVKAWQCSRQWSKILPICPMHSARGMLYNATHLIGYNSFFIYFGLLFVLP